MTRGKRMHSHPGAKSRVNQLIKRITPKVTIVIFREHISQACRCCFYFIRDVRRIRWSLSVAKTITTAPVRSRLDYCYSIFLNIALKDIMKYHHVHNCLVRVVTRSPRLKSVHWLPVRYRIIFKIYTITYQAISSKQPTHLHSLLPPARQHRQLRYISSSSFPLFFPSVKTNVGTRCLGCRTNSVELAPN